MTTENIIEVRGLEKHFNDGELKALQGVDTEVHRGEVMVVIGPSGSGKSTFLRCLNLLEKPTKGTITFEGVDITSPSVNINIHRQKMGMVFQHFNLFPHMTVLRNMTLAPVKLKNISEEEATEKAMTLLERVGRRKQKKRLWNCWSVSDCRKKKTPIPLRFPADRSSGSRLYGRCAWSRRSCCSTNRRRPWIRKWSARCWTS